MGHFQFYLKGASSNLPIATLPQLGHGMRCASHTPSHFHCASHLPLSARPWSALRLTPRSGSRIGATMQRLWGGGGSQANASSLLTGPLVESPVYGQYHGFPLPQV